MRHNAPAMVAKSLAGARPAPQPDRRLDGAEQSDLAVIGGGFSGLWPGLLAKERDPSRDVVLVEGRRIAWGGTGRNGGFCAASLTHGLGNGLERFPGEIGKLDQLGRRNLDEIEAAVVRHGIDCDFARTGELAVATQHWQLAGLRQTAEAARDLGGSPVLLNTAQVRAQVSSPTYLGGLWDTDGCAIVDPARLAWGLRRACGTPMAAGSWTRPGWPGACAGPAWMPESGTTSTARCWRSATSRDHRAGSS